MNELATLLPFLAYAFAVALLGALIRWLMRWDHSVPIVGPLRAVWDLPWPRGVQEEEPVRWNLEALRPRRAGSAPAAPSVRDTHPARRAAPEPVPCPPRAVRPAA